MNVKIDDLLAAMKRLNRIVKADNADGHQWRYYNGKRSEPTFKKTRAAGKYITNCMGGVSFACKEAGIPASALQWYGGMGKIVWLSDKAKADCKKYFDIITLKKTVRTGVKKGMIQPGDILTYTNMTHTNAYYGDSLSYDTGHAYCVGNGEGAPYKKWIGSLAHSNKKVAYILRLKGSYIYRVQVGAFNAKANADKRVAEVAQKSGFGCFIEQMDMMRVYCGSFENPRNAIDRVDDLEKAGISGAFIIMKE